MRSLPQLIIALLLLASCRSTGVFGAEPPPGIRTIAKIPRGEADVALAHRNSNGQTCDLLPQEAPLEISSFVKQLLPADDRDLKAKQLPNSVTRRQVCTVGINVLDDDHGRMPVVSRAKILDYLDKHYVSIQARVQKDPIRGSLYLHHRPIALMMESGKKTSVPFYPAVQKAVKDFHSLGIYLPEGTAPTPENLRTAVLVHKHNVSAPNPVRAGADRIESHYEFVFLRAKSNSLGTKLDIHVFTTTENRVKLHWVRPGSNPARANDCSLKGTVYFTKYESGDLIPSESIMRKQFVSSRAVFTWKELDAFVKDSLSLKGTALENLNETLDAIIDGKIKPTAEETETK